MIPSETDRLWRRTPSSVASGGFGRLERDSLKWIPVQGPVMPSTYENEPVYPLQMIPSETDRL